jgi:hypothetical protein
MNAAGEFTITTAILFGLPALTVWGWFRWSVRTKERSVFASLSLAGFSVATLSSLLAVSTIIYSLTASAFSYYAPTLIGIYRWGALISLAGLTLSIAGAVRTNPLRWHAPICAFGIFLFWLFAAISE